MSDMKKIVLADASEEFRRMLAELVAEEREKNFIYYQLRASVLEEIMLWMSDLMGEEKTHEEA